MASVTVLPLDIERVLPGNIQTNEIHNTVTATGKVNRVIVPDRGAFFIDGFEIRDKNGVLLERHKQYELTYHYELFSEMAGQGVCALVVITDTTKLSPFSITYHAVGGPYSISVKEISDVLAYICSAEHNKFKWEDIVDAPTAYVPEKHFNEYWQIYGLESTVTELHRLGDAINVGRKAIIADNSDYWLSYANDAQARLDAYKDAVMRHVTDRNNPHATDKYKVSLGNINNWGLADYAQSVDVNNASIYQPIGGIFNQLNLTAIPALDAHRRDQAAVGKPDPHNVTLAQINAYSKAQINSLFALRLERTQMAYDTTLFAGLTFAGMTNNVRSNLTTNNVIQGHFTPYDPTKVFQMNQMAPVPNVSPQDIIWYILCGDQQYRHVSTMIQSWNASRTGVVFVGNAGGTIDNKNTLAGALAAINAYQDPTGVIPVGTKIVGSYNYDVNGGRRTQRLVICVYNADGSRQQIY